MEKEKFLEDFDVEKFADNFPGGFFIYEAKGKEKLLYANHILYQLWGCETEEEFSELTGNTFTGMVHADDLRRVENEIYCQIQTSEHKFDNVDYRIVRKDGKVRWVEDFGRLVTDEKYGDIFYVFVMDVTEKREEIEKREFYEYIQKLKSIFDVVRLVDVSRTEEYIINAEGKLTKQPYECFAVWNKSSRCENCVSLQALACKGKVTKFEFIGRDVYHVTAKYMEISGRPLVLEMVSKIQDEMLFGAFGKDYFVDTLQKYNQTIYVDTLTGAYNRRFFDVQLKNLEFLSGLAFVAIDRYKELSESYGDSAGKKALTAVAHLIRTNIQKTDALVRFGKDWFLIVFQSADNCRIEHCLENIRTKSELTEFEEYPDMHITVSIGACLCHSCHSEDIRKTKKLLSEAKAKGNRIVLESGETK